MTIKNISGKPGETISYKLIKDGYKTINNSITLNSVTPKTIQIDSPSEEYIADVQYAIDVTKEYSPIISFTKNITAPDESEISKKDYLLAPYGKEYLVTDTKNALDNFTRVDSINIDKEGNVNNFTTTSTLITPEFTFGKDDYELIIGFKLTSTVNDDYYVLFGATTDCTFNIAISSTLKLHSNTGNKSYWSTGLNGTTTIELNTDYLLKITRINGVRYQYLSKDNGETWTDEGSINDTQSYAGKFYLGRNSANGQIAKNVIISLAKTNIKINNEVVWQPTWNILANNFRTSGAVYNNNGIISNLYSPNTAWPFFTPKTDTWEFVSKCKTARD